MFFKKFGKTLSKFGKNTYKQIIKPIGGFVDKKIFRPVNQRIIQPAENLVTHSIDGVDSVLTTTTQNINKLTNIVSNPIVIVVGGVAAVLLIGMLRR